MKYRATGFRVVKDIPRIERERQAITEFVRTETARRTEETATERELRLFLAGEIPFSDCQSVPAEYRVFEHPRFYRGPALTTSDDRHYMAGYASADDDADDEDDSSTTDVIEADSPRLGWDFLDEWGDLQPSCC